MMDYLKEKLCCSLRWLSSVVPPRQLQEEIGGDSGTGCVTVKQLLLSPYQRNTLREEVINLLTSPNLYICAHGSIIPNERLKGDNTFWPLIQSLAKRGIYVLEEDESVVNHSVLAQRDPFKQKSHLALLDALMTLYASKIVTIERMVRTVRTISRFNASRELPSCVEDSLILWLNKVSEAICQLSKEENTALLLDPDPIQRRRNKVKLMNQSEMSIPTINQLGAGIADGQCLAALLLHYHQDSVEYSDFHFGDGPLTKQQCLQNLNKAEGIYSTILSPGAFHLSPGEILRWSQSNVLNCNIQALLAHLYYFFEVSINFRKSHAKPMKNNSDGQLQTNKNHKDTGNLSRRQNLLRSSKLLSKGTDGTQKLGMLSQTQLHSFSTSDLKASVSSRALVSQQRMRPLVVDTQARSAASNHTLSSFSASALVPDSKENRNSKSSVQSSTTVFKAPIRSSFSVTQAAALTHFDRRSMELGKGPHTQSSPTIHVSTPFTDPPQPPRRDIITASTDNLMIREQMLASKLKRTAMNRADLSNSIKPKSLLVPHSSHSASDISGGSDNEFTTSSPGADISGNCTTSWNAATAGKGLPYAKIPLLEGHTPPFQPPETEADHLDAATLLCSVPEDDTKFSTIPPLLQLQATKSEPKEIARRSFTLDKRHTIASASAAGLPIIGSSKAYDYSETQPVNVSPIDMDSNETLNRLREKEPFANCSSPSRPPHIHDKTGSTSSSSSSPTIMCLVVYSDPKDGHKSGEKEFVASVPGSVVEQLRLVLNACKNTHSMQERNVPTKLQQLRQKVHLSYMNRIKESKTRKSSYTHSNTTAGSRQKQVPTRENQEDTHTVTTPPNTTHIIVPSDPPVHSVTCVTSQPESSGGVQNTRDNGVLLPQSSTAKKLPLGQCQPLMRELPLSPIAHSDALGNEEASKSPSRTCVVPERIQHNPWIEIDAGEGQKSDMMTQEEVRRRKELQVKARLDEREKDRRRGMEKRRKQQAKKRATQELMKATEKNVASTEVAPGATAPTAIPADGDTLHFKLSSHDLHQEENPQQLHSRPTSSSTTSHQHTASAIPTPIPTPSHSRLSEYLNHNGPDCYVKPQSKSNKKIIKNALCHVCLAGEVNVSLKQRALAELESANATHVLILFRDTVGFKFRGLYSFIPDTNYITKIFGSGPKVVKESMMSHLYKYNSGLKEFREVLSWSFSISVDALTIKNQHWARKTSHR